MPVLSEASEILGSPLGSFVYHLVLLLAVEAGLAMVLREWQRDRREQTRRLLLSMIGLTIVRVAYIGAVLVTTTGTLSPEALLPPLERFVDTASIALLGWAFAPSARRGERTWTFLFGANLVVAVGVLVASTIVWSRTLGSGAPGDFTASWQATVWTVWQIGLLLLASLAIVRNEREEWGIPLVAMLIMLVGRLLQLVYPALVPNLPIWVRLSNLIAYPLITIALYQHFVAATRVHVRNVEDISQASLDEIKSLLLLSEAGRQVSGSLNLPVVLDRAVRGTARALDADQCAIAFPMEDDPGHMRLEAVYNPTRQGRGDSVTFPLDFQLAVQQAMRRKKHVIIEEMDNVQIKVLFSLLGSGESGPLLVQPLLLDGETIGAMIVGNSNSRRPFTPHEAKLCQSMAEHVVGAIRNAWRYQESQDKVKELQRALDRGGHGAQESTGRIREQTERVASLPLDSEEADQRARTASEPSTEAAGQVVDGRADAELAPEQAAVLRADVIQPHSDLEPPLIRHEEQLARGPVE